MKYACPNCPFGELQPTKSTYVRRVGPTLFSIPDFPTWHCDCCGYTRYDSAALARVKLLLGPEESDMLRNPRSYSQSGEGPGEHGPHRWSV